MIKPWIVTARLSPRSYAKLSGVSLKTIKALLKTNIVMTYGVVEAN